MHPLFLSPPYYHPPLAKAGSENTTAYKAHDGLFQIILVFISIIVLACFLLSPAGSQPNASNTHEKKRVKLSLCQLI
jgi:hypothetical protein